jgi:hypothetical protein
MKKITLLFILIILIFNLTPAKWIAGYDDLLYSNETGTFTFNEANYAGRNYQLCKVNFEEYKKNEKTDTILYRITQKNFFKFWRWGDYLTKEKYKLPYRDWKEIERVRGPIVNKSAWQAF